MIFLKFNYVGTCNGKLADDPSRGSKKEVDALIPHIKWLDWENDSGSEDVGAIVFFIKSIDFLI